MRGVEGRGGGSWNCGVAECRPWPHLGKQGVEVGDQCNQNLPENATSPMIEVKDLTSKKTSHKSKTCVKCPQIKIKCTNVTEKRNRNRTRKSSTKISDYNPALSLREQLIFSKANEREHFLLCTKQKQIMLHKCRVLRQHFTNDPRIKSELRPHSSLFLSLFRLFFYQETQLDTL